MAFDRQSLRLSLEFTITGTDEVAETGLLITGGLGFAALTALADPTDADLRSFATTYASVVSGGGFVWADYSHLVGVKLAALDTSGHYLAAPREVAPTSPLQGGSTHTPAQLSLEFGLWSGEAIGRANYGKMYLPHTRMLLDSNSPYISSATVATSATAFAAWITGLNGSAGGWTGSPEVKVMSRLGSGTTKTVQSVRFGRVIDTQRRRRNRLAESYSVAAV
jgi:hypothetical protein